MTNINIDAIPTFAGILHPAIQNRFILTISSTMVSKEFKDLISTNVTKCHIDCINKTVSFNVQQPIGHAEMLNSLHQIFGDKNDAFGDNMGSISVLFMDGSGTPVSAAKFLQCVPVSHKFNLDYGVNDVASHDIVVGFKHIQTS